MRFIPVVAVLTLVPQAAPNLDGAFTLRAANDGARVHINFQYADGRSNWGRTFDRTALSDVSTSGDRIRFTMRRDPGTFSFEGRGTLARATGWYGFAPSARFRRAMEQQGFRDVDAKALFVFALDGLTIGGVKQLKGLVSDDLDTGTLVRLINHGAGLRFIQSMTDAGFTRLSSDEYRRARDHGVSAEFAREMAQLGMTLSLAELVRARDHGVSVEYVRAMRDAGYTLAHDELIRARDHGVTTAFVKRLGELGYRGLPIAEYIRMRDHGVTSEFVEGLRAEGYTKLTAGELVRMRDHGVTASYVRRVTAMLKESPTVEQIIRMRSSGFPVR
jgi:hypothetical protein